MFSLIMVTNITTVQLSPVSYITGGSLMTVNYMKLNIPNRLHKPGIKGLIVIVKINPSTHSLDNKLKDQTVISQELSH